MGSYLWFPIPLCLSLMTVTGKKYSPGDARYTCYRYPIYLFWHFTLFITGEPSINFYFSLIFTCMGSHVLNLGHSSLPTILKTLGGKFVYSLPTFQSDIPEILEKETFILHSLSHRRYKYRWRSIYLGVMVTFQNRWRNCNRYTWQLQDWNNSVTQTPFLPYFTS